MKIEIKVPEAGESVTEADIASWYKSTGDVVEMDDALCELETDKASMDLPAEGAGVLTILVDEGETVNVGDVIATIDTDGAGAAPETNNEEKTPAQEPLPNTDANQVTTPQAGHYAQGHPSPAAQKASAKHNVDTSTIQGTGKDGRITKSDVETAAASKQTQPAVLPPQLRKEEPAPIQAATSGTERVSRTEPLTRIRKTIMKRLVDTQQEMALLTTFNEVDLSTVMSIRSKYKEAFKEKHQVGLGFMSFFTKACCIALRDFPVINARVEDQNIIYQDYADISVAVSTPKGLVVPVVKNAHTMTFNQIESSILDFAKRGRDGKLTIQDMEGGTFTITNGGVFGSMMSTPIINRPQSAILGMHNIVKRPVVVNDEIVIRPMMYIALTYDHRIIDGSDAVRFLVRVKELLEDPHRLLIDI